VPLPDSRLGLKKQRRLRGHRPLSPPGAYRFAPDPISKKRKNKNPTERLLFFLLRFLSRSRLIALEITKTLVYCLSTGISGEAKCRRRSVVSWLITASRPLARGAAAWAWKLRRPPS